MGDEAPALQVRIEINRFGRPAGWILVEYVGWLESERPLYRWALGIQDKVVGGGEIVHERNDPIDVDLAMAMLVEDLLDTCSGRNPRSFNAATVRLVYANAASIASIWADTRRR